MKRTEKHLPNWQNIYLLKGEKLFLVKDVLSSLPIYFLSSFTVPESVAARLKKLQKKILVG